MVNYSAIFAVNFEQGFVYCYMIQDSVGFVIDFEQPELF